MVDVFEFHGPDGDIVGCGTQAEFDHWTAQGVFVGYRIGAKIAEEPAAMDDQREAAWAVA